MQSPGELLAAELNRLKKANGWSAADIAQIAEVSVGTIQNALKGRAANPYHLPKIVEKLKLDPKTFAPQTSGLALSGNVMSKICEWAGEGDPAAWMDKFVGAVTDHPVIEMFVRELGTRQRPASQEVSRGAGVGAFVAGKGGAARTPPVDNSGVPARTAVAPAPAKS